MAVPLVANVSESVKGDQLTKLLLANELEAIKYRTLYPVTILAVCIKKVYTIINQNLCPEAFDIILLKFLGFL